MRLPHSKPRRIALLMTSVLLAVVGVTFVFPALARWESPAAVERDIARLTHERDSLRALVSDAAERSELFARRPAGDVLIALPSPFVDSLVHDIVTGWFHDVQVTLHGIVIRKSADVRAPMGALGRRRVGSYDLDLTLDDVRGHMTAGAPALEFGGDIIKVALPVKVTDGKVKATVAIAWESKGLANVICGDASARHAVTGTVRESEHIAIGRLVLSARDGAVVVDPEFPALAIRLFADPDPTSVAVLDSLLATQGGLCGFAVQKVRVSDLIVRRVERGFLIRIPQTFFRPVRLPISVEREVQGGERALTLVVSPRDLVVTSAAVWLAADVHIAPRTP